MRSPSSFPTRRPLGPRSALLRLALGALLAAACTDAPLTDPAAQAEPGVLRIGSSLSFRGAVAGTPQADALNAAFDRVDRFRLVIRRASNGEIVKDTVITVTPGQDSYDLSSPVPSVLPNEVFTVVITALQGDVVLFESDPVSVIAVPEGAAPGATPLPEIKLDYTGPGAEAAAVAVAPLAPVVAPGGTRALTATVRTSAGVVVAGVPVSWSTASAAVATVSGAGTLTGVGDGATLVTVTTPTGLTATTWAYVVTGELAYVQGGHVRLRAAAGGTVADQSPGATAATAPTFGPGGNPLAWADGGRVFVGGTSVTDGAFPAISPDGTKLAVERAGRVWFTNLNGSNPTEGPAGTTPAWMPDNAHLAVGGGSVQRVKADGTGRTTLVGGSAALPALGAGGAVASVAGGALVVEGRGTVLSGVTGRPAWSPSGRWLVAPTGTDLMLVDPTGAAPPVALGTGTASDPAWRGAAFAAAAVPPSIASLSPNPAVPGGEVTLIGRGFDWIIPANNRVFFPGTAGSLPGEIRSVTDTRLVVLMPAATIGGSIRVATNVGEGTFGFVPSIGSIRVRARFPGDLPAPGMHVVVRGGAADAVVGEADTDAEGRASFNLAPGAYRVQLTVPAGHTVTSTNPVPLTLAFAVSAVTFDVGLVPSRVVIDPANPRLAVGAAPLTVRARAFDVRGQEVNAFNSIRWDGGLGVAASGNTVNGSLVGTTATAERAGKFAVYLDGEAYEFDATVTAAISGTVRSSEGGTPEPGVTVELRQGEGAIASTTTDGSGRYRIDGLLAGSYEVSVADGEGMSSPSSRDVTLGGNAVNQDFTLSNSFDGGPQRPNVMVCGGSQYSVTNFFPEGLTYTVQSGCAPDGNTQALFITRSGYQYSAAWLKAYLDAGGIVITEWSNSHNVWNAAFDTNVSPGGWNGGCYDMMPTNFQFTPTDPFWVANAWQPPPPGQSGCGYNVAHFPGIVPIAGWNSTAVSVGYRNRGYGRVWAADFDWQDTENYYKAYSNQLMGWMMTHRGGVLPAVPPAMKIPAVPVGPPAGRAQIRGTGGNQDTRAIPAGGERRRVLPRQR